MIWFQKCIWGFFSFIINIKGTNNIFIWNFLVMEGKYNLNCQEAVIFGVCETYWTTIYDFLIAYLMVHRYHSVVINSLNKLNFLFQIKKNESEENFQLSFNNRVV